MMRSMTSKLVPVTVLALALGLALAPAARAGMRYEARTVTDVDRGQDGTMVAKGWIEGERGRVELGEVEGPQARVLGGGYLVTTDGGRIVYLVDPKEKTYSRFDLAGALGALGQMMQAMGGVVDFDISNVANEMVLEEAGPSILGHDTKHYRWKTSYVFELSVMGFQQRNEVQTVTDTWVAEGIVQPGFGVWLQNRPVATGDEDLDAMIAAEASRVKGMPLKTVAETVTRNKKGQESRSTVTTEVTLLEETSVEDAMFQVPAGYEEVVVTPYG
jgi:hypothetical protein